MQRAFFQTVLFLFLAILCVSGFLFGRHILQLPFRPTNDALHQRNSPINLDFLIPSGTYLDEKITIGEVAKKHIKREESTYGRLINALCEMIPPRYLYLADFLVFLFWCFCFMTFFRVFTFMGYGRALRASLLLAGVSYYFMPDFSPGRGDDVTLVGIPVLIILLRFYLVRRKRRRKRSEI